MMPIKPIKPIGGLVGAFAFVLMWWMFNDSPSIGTHPWITDGALTLCSGIVGLAWREIRKNLNRLNIRFEKGMESIERIDKRMMLVFMEHEQIAQWWQENHMGEMRASEQYAKAMSMGKAAGAD